MLLALVLSFFKIAPGVGITAQQCEIGALLGEWNHERPPIAKINCDI